MESPVPKKIKIEGEGSKRVSGSITAGLSSNDDDDVQVLSQSSLPVVSPPGVRTNDSDTGVEVVGTRGGYELPHMRQHCTVHPYQVEKISADKDNHSSPNISTCPLCYCYVCDVPIKDCTQWKEHCDATDAASYWKMKREKHKKEARRIELKLVNARRLKVMFDTLKAFLGKCYMNIDGSRVKILQMSTDHVVFLQFRLCSHIFESYRLTAPDIKHLTIDITEIDTKRVLRGLSKAKISDTVTMKASKSSIDLHFENEANPEKAPRPYHMELPLPADPRRYSTPDYDYPYLMRMPSTMFRHIILTFYETMTCSGDGDHELIIAMTFRDDWFAIEAFREGDCQEGRVQRGRIQLRSRAHEPCVVICNDSSGGTITQLFTAHYLVSLVRKATPLGPNVFICMRREAPLKLLYPLPWENDTNDTSAKFEDSTFCFHMAPRKFD